MPDTITITLAQNKAAVFFFSRIDNAVGLSWSPTLDAAKLPLWTSGVIHNDPPLDPRTTKFPLAEHNLSGTTTYRYLSLSNAGGAGINPWRIKGELWLCSRFNQTWEGRETLLWSVDESSGGTAGPGIVREWIFIIVML